MTTPTAVSLSPCTYENIGYVTGFQIAPAGVGQFNVYNGDIENVLYVSQSKSPQLTNSLPVEPLTNATVGGGNNGAWYASAASGQTVAQVVVSGSSQISPSPAQIAAQIAALGLATATNQGTQITEASSTNGYLGSSSSGALVGTAGNTVGEEVAALIATGSASGTPGGVPLLGNPVTQSSASMPSTIAASGTLTVVSNLNLEGFLSWDLHMTAECNAASLNPFVTLNIQWLSASGGTVMWDEIWTVAADETATNQTIGGGPVRAGFLTMVITNLDSVNSLTIETFVLQASSRPYADPDTNLITQNAGGVNPVYTKPSHGSNLDGVVGYWTGTLAANASAELIGGMNNGTENAIVSVSGTSPNLAVTISTIINGFAIPCTPTFDVGTEADSQSIVFYQPRGALIVNLTNNNASDSVTYIVTVVEARTT